MDYFLTEEQQMIVDIARQITDEKIIPQRAELDEKEEFATEILNDIAQADLFGDRERGHIAQLGVAVQLGAGAGQHAGQVLHIFHGAHQVAEVVFVGLEAADMDDIHVGEFVSHDFRAVHKTEGGRENRIEALARQGVSHGQHEAPPLGGLPQLDQIEPVTFGVEVVQVGQDFVPGEEVAIGPDGAPEELFRRLDRRRGRRRGRLCLSFRTRYLFDTRGSRIR